MWAQVCDTQDPSTPKALIANLRLLFGLSKGSIRETARYLGKIRNLILRCKLRVQYLSAPLVNLIAVQNLDIYRYQNVLDGYKVGSID